MKKAFLVLCILCSVVPAKAQTNNLIVVPENGMEALIASQNAFDRRYYNLADHYADIALKDSVTAKDAAEIKIQCMGKLMKTQQDSTKFIIALLELHSMDKANPIFMKLLMEYFSQPGHHHEMREFATDEIREDPDNKLAWVLRGETFMREHEWDDAISNFKKAVKLDTAFVEAIYNIGICYSSKAVEIKDSIQTDHKRLKSEEKDSIESLFRESAKWLEKAQTLDPERKIVDWKVPLYQVYYVLKDKRAKDLKK